MDWFTEWREGVTESLLAFMQTLWSWVVQIFGLIIHDPVPVAIGLAVSVFIVMFGLIIGRAIFRRIDRKKSDKEDDNSWSHEDELYNPFADRFTIPGDDP